jgi:hypothetical protein
MLQNSVEWLAVTDLQTIVARTSLVLVIQVVKAIFSSVGRHMKRLIAAHRALIERPVLELKNASPL